MLSNGPRVGGGEERETKVAKLLSQGFEAKTAKLKKSRFAMEKLR